MKSGIRLRSATLADAEALGAVHIRAWQEAYAGVVPDKILSGLNFTQCADMWRSALAQGLMVQLAERNGKIVAFSASGDQTDASLPYSGIIRALYVLRCAQHLGIGRRLMAATADDLLARGHMAAMLWVMEANTAARRFYVSLGGREIARTEQDCEGFHVVGIAYAWDDLMRLIPPA
jgi:ribosomal protein S18 acetylase RimI-like enzyme